MRTGLLMIVFAVFAGGCGGFGSGTTRPATPVAAPAKTAAIGAREAAIIRSYYDAPERGGRGQSGDLPPGIAKNLQRGKPLPPGIAKRQLPPELLGRLPAAPSGFQYFVVAGKIVLVEIATQIIHDILIDVVL